MRMDVRTIAVSASLPPSVGCADISPSRGEITETSGKGEDGDRGAKGKEKTVRN